MSGLQCVPDANSSIPGQPGGSWHDVTFTMSGEAAQLPFVPFETPANVLEGVGGGSSEDAAKGGSDNQAMDGNQAHGGAAWSHSSVGLPFDFDFGLPDHNLNSGFQMPVNPAGAAPYSSQPSSSHYPTFPSHTADFFIPPPPVPATVLPDTGSISELQRQQVELVFSRVHRFISSPKGALINARGVCGYLAELVPEKIEFAYYETRQSMSPTLAIGFQFFITSDWFDKNQVPLRSLVTVPRSVVLTAIIRHLREVGREGFGFMNMPIQYPYINSLYWITDGGGGEGDGVVWPNGFGNLVLRWLRPRNMLEMRSHAAYMKGCSIEPELVDGNEDFRGLLD